MKVMSLILCVFLNGCLGLFDSPPDSETIFLPELMDLPPVASSHNITLKINRPTLPQWLDTEKLFIRENDVLKPIEDIQLIEKVGDHFHYHLINTLKKSTLYHHVGSAQDDFEGQQKLSMDIKKFWIEKKGAEHQGHLAFSLTMIDDESRKILFDKSYTCQGSLKKWVKQELIQTLGAIFNQCLYEVIDQLQKN